MNIMTTLINNLQFNQNLYITNRGTNYNFIRIANDGGIVYSINNNRKTLPLHTILTALNDSNNGININRTWYRNFNEAESRSRGCNLGVLRNLIEMFNSIL